MTNPTKGDRLRKLTVTTKQPAPADARAELRRKIERLKTEIEANGRELRKLRAAYDRPAGRLH
jgi:hypothetical protein